MELGEPPADRAVSRDKPSGIMSQPAPVDSGDGDGPLDRFRAWRHRIRSRPSTNRVYRVVVAAIGLAITVGGLALVPLPGPGWLIVFLGIAVLASEFESARRVEQFGKRVLKAWAAWLQGQSWSVRVLVALATAVLVALVLYGVALVFGVPGWVPDGLVASLPGLS
jgi:uncharacterized protein (TIGR02611 family)